VLTVVGGTVLEALACGGQIDDQASQIADKLVAKTTQ
jgi:hypothetical protein